MKKICKSQSEENLLMAIANKIRVYFTEYFQQKLSTGYGTLYGDTMAGSAVGRLLNCQAYALANYINRNGETIPQKHYR